VTRLGHTAFADTILPFLTGFYKSQLSQKVYCIDASCLTALTEQ